MAGRVMADSGPVAAPLIPSVAPKASIVAASPGWSSGTWAKLGSRGYTRLRYTHDPTDWSADILDVEPGYASAGDVPGWLDRRRAAGLAPGTVYANVSRIASVKQAASGRPFYWWASDQTGFPHGVPGAVAVQWFGSRQRSLWRGVDVSLVTGSGWPPAGQSTWWRGVQPPAGPDPQAPPSPGSGPGGAPGRHPTANAQSSSSMGTPNGLGSMFGGDTTGGDLSAPADTSGTDTGAAAGSGGLSGGWLWLLAAGGVVVAWLVIRDERKRGGQGQ